MPRFPAEYHLQSTPPTSRCGSWLSLEARPGRESRSHKSDPPAVVLPSAGRAWHRPPRPRTRSPIRPGLRPLRRLQTRSPTGRKPLARDGKYYLGDRCRRSSCLPRRAGSEPRQSPDLVVSSLPRSSIGWSEPVNHLCLQDGLSRVLIGAGSTCALPYSPTTRVSPGCGRKDSARAASATVEKDSVKITQVLSDLRLPPIMDSAAWQSSRCQSEIINESIQLLG